MTAIDTSVTSTRPLLRERQGVDAFVALMYHNICDDEGPPPDVSPADSAYFVTLSAFAEQMSALHACGAHCMRREALEATYGFGRSEQLPRSSSGYPVLLTFDDGWRGVVEYGGPILELCRAQAILFVTYEYLNRRHFLSMREVSRLNQDVFQIGSHAMTHRLLSVLDEDEIRAELADSKRGLEDLVGSEVDSLSIPNGAVDQRVRRIAAECGYRFIFDSSVRVNRGRANPLSIGRLAVKRTTPIAAFRRFVQHRTGGEWWRRVMLATPKRLLGLRRYDVLRRRLLGDCR